ncbi:MAG: type II toxin-antitoxin system PemK/MazF family toxin [Candidatus Aminicenantales bacterium]
MKQVFFAPDRGDVVLISVPPLPDRGRDASQKSRSTSRCAAVVLSPQSYNQRVGLAVLCPISARVKGYPFEVPIPPDLPVAGVILADQAVSLDWRACRAERIGSVPTNVLQEALGKLRALMS